MSKRKPFLIEVGCEEIPARIVRDALEQLEDLFSERLKNSRIDFEGPKVYGTPRRLTLYIDSVSLRQNDVTKRIIGPPAGRAFDDEGSPTEAAKGFARSKDLAVEDLEIFETDKGKYAGADITIEGKDTSEILPDLIPDILESLTFPRTMRWGKGNHSFIRPVRNLCVMLGKEIVDTEFCGVSSSGKVQGHRYIHPEYIDIPDPQRYVETLKKASVVVCPEERKNIIENQLRQTAESLGGEPNRDEDLLRTVSFLMENPGVITGSFEERFLELPGEVLITCMKVHQKYFALRDPDERMMPNFLAVVDIEENKEVKERVTRGHEWVLHSRLADAEFFWESDRKKSSKERLSDLKHVIFRKGLGTYREKADRLKDLSEKIGGRLDLNVDALREAARLCKTDLVTDMVNEFPSLQGIMGGLCAAEEGKDETTAEIIYHHYKPRSSGDDIPELAEGGVLSLMDKLDTLVGSFAMGADPSGSKDPYGLRGKARSIVRIIIEKDFDLPVEKMIEDSYSVFRDKEFQLSSAETHSRIKDFLLDRLFNLLKDRGYEHDTVSAVYGARNSTFPEIKYKVEALSETKDDEDIQSLILTFKRIQNIVQDGLDTNVDRALFENDYEKKFFKICDNKKESFYKRLETKDYPEALRVLISLREPIDEFFEKVMVMVDDEDIKINRMALLNNIANFFLEMADISKLDVEIK